MQEQKVNATYEADVSYAMRMSKVIMTIIGLRPLSQNRSKIYKTIAFLQSVFCISILLFVLLPCFAYLYFIEKRTFVRIRFVAPIIFNLSGVIKYCLLLYRRNEITSCVEHMEEDWMNASSKRVKDVMLESAKIGRTLGIYCIFFMYFGGFSFRAIMPLLGKRRVVNNVTIRPLSFPGYYRYFNVQKTPAYEIVFSLQLLSGFVIYTTACCICNVAASLIMHGAGQLKILQDLIEELPKKSNKKHGTERIAKIVRHHARLLRYMYSSGIV